MFFFAQRKKQFNNVPHTKFLGDEEIFRKKNLCNEAAVWVPSLH